MRQFSVKYGGWQRQLQNPQSAKLRLNRAAIALHFAFYHFCRVHMTLQVTPAMELGITNHKGKE